MTTWLVTGGNGYIGSHITDTLLSSNLDLVVLDRDISQRPTPSHPNLLASIQGDYADQTLLQDIFATYNPTGIIHTAALKSAPESTERPITYFQENLTKMQVLLEEFKKYQPHTNEKKKFIFSSSAAVYGNGDESAPTTENYPTKPTSPYGMTKLAGEFLLKSVAESSGMFAISLRYFNVIGTSTEDKRDTGRTNLLPIIRHNLESDATTSIYGSTYQTHDGTPVRDYISVQDIADLTLHSARLLDELAESNHTEFYDVFNAGFGVGRSVLDVVNQVNECLPEGRELSINFSPKRHGDPSYIVSDMTKAKHQFGWEPKVSFDLAVQDALGLGRLSQEQEQENPS